MLRVSDLRVRYGRIEVLHRISFEAKAGEVTCLIGPNGAGKTTTLWTLAGVLRPAGGQVHFMDQDLTALAAPAVVRRGLSLVPENRLIFPGLTVLENLRMGAYLRLRADKAGVAADIDKMLEYFPPLRLRLDQEAGKMSGGEQQMLAVARALMARPQMLMLDEPSLGLAPMVVEGIFNIIRSLHRDGVSILLVEQNVEWAVSFADHIVLLELGEVTFAGDPATFNSSDISDKALWGRTSSQANG